jgi:death-on-curing protein
VISPTWEDIILLNHRLIEETGGLWIGPDNLRNSGSLKWVLEAIQYPLFGFDLYPTLAEKAALLAWIIIDDHVFHDGCKRTGMAALEVFILLNGYRLGASGDEIRDVAILVAQSTQIGYTRDDFVSWVRGKICL